MEIGIDKRLRGMLLMSVACAAGFVGCAACADTPSTPTDDGLGEIIVTDGKRETNLQRTAVAISVPDADALADRHVQGLGDLMDGAVPSLRIVPFASRSSALTAGIRGIVPFDANQPSRDAAAGIYDEPRTRGVEASLRF